MIDFKISPGTAGNSDIPERYDDLPSHDIEVFQSENIQNILDAKTSSEECVEVHYSLKKLSSDEIENLKKILGTEFFKKLETSFSKSEAQDLENHVQRVKTALKNQNKWYSLIIEEKNTTGLLGDETGAEKGSNYHALMRHTNKSEKEGVTGGTFGKGSSVYTYSSGLWLWFAYSVLDTKWENTKARFVGRGMIAPFIDRDGNQSYDGPLWFSRPEAIEEYINGHPQQGLPFVNAEAHAMAKKFGLPKRKENDPGTTYLIPVFWPDGIEEEEMSAEILQKKLKTEIIKRWFIPIYNSKLKCSIKTIGEDTEEKLTKNELYNIPELKYKLEILDWYRNQDKNDKRFKIGEIELKLPTLTDSQQKLAKVKYGKKIGYRQLKVKLQLVIRELFDSEKEFTGFLDDDNIGTVNRVALVRNKGMIVNHYPYDDKHKKDFLELPGKRKFEAILFAGKMSEVSLTEEERDHLEMFLSFAENPAHNEWVNNKNDLNKCNLKRFNKNPVPYPVNRVNSIFIKLHNLVNQFFPKDDKPPLKKNICSFWRRLYKLPSTGVGSNSISNYSYETLEEGFDDENRYYWKFRFTNLQSDQIRLQFEPYLNTLEGPVKNIEDFKELGVPDIKEILIFQQGTKVEDVILEYDDKKQCGIPVVVELKTCKLTNNKFLKNVDPVLEITDIKI